MCSEEDKVVHLTLIVSELAQGRDILEIPTAEGGLLLDENEDDLLDIITEISQDLVPNYYDGNWTKFLRDFMQSLDCAGQDLKQSIENGEEVSDTHFTDHLQLWINSIFQVGRKMVA